MPNATDRLGATAHTPSTSRSESEISGKLRLIVPWRLCDMGSAVRVQMYPAAGLASPPINRRRARPMRLRRAGYLGKLSLCRSIKYEGVARTARPGSLSNLGNQGSIGALPESTHDFPLSTLPGNRYGKLALRRQLLY